MKTVSIFEKLLLEKNIGVSRGQKGQVVPPPPGKWVMNLF